MSIFNSRYLDPVNDIPFKKVFMLHKHLCISLLNSLLPLEGRKITELDYLPRPLLPRIDSIGTALFDVRCVDDTGRQFLVEIQIYWSDSFKFCTRFDGPNISAKWFKEEELEKQVKALPKMGVSGSVFNEVPTVYSLNLLNIIFEKSPKMAEVYYHHYPVVNLKPTGKRIKGLELIFVELPKFKPTNKAERKFDEMWLRYFTEVSTDNNEAPPDLLEIKETREAIALLERYTYSEAEMYHYDRVIDAVWVEYARISDARKEARAKVAERNAIAEEKAAAAEEKAAAIEEITAAAKKFAAAEEKAAAAEEKAAVVEEIAAIAKKITAAEEKIAAAEAKAAEAAKRDAEEKRAFARKLKAMGAPADVIAETTGLSAAEIETF
jgi:hypothetical protein